MFSILRKKTYYIKRIKYKMTKIVKINPDYKKIRARIVSILKIYEESIPNYTFKKIYNCENNMINISYIYNSREDLLNYIIKKTS